MKPITALVLAALAGLGAACSATASDAAAETPPAEPALETADAGSDVEGTFNLNIGRTGDAPARPIISAESAGSAGGLNFEPGSTGGNFEGVEGLGIEIDTSAAAALEPAAPSDEDEIVRLPEQD